MRSISLRCWARRSGISWVLVMVCCDMTGEFTPLDTVSLAEVGRVWTTGDLACALLEPKGLSFLIIGATVWFAAMS